MVVLLCYLTLSIQTSKLAQGRVQCCIRITVCWQQLSNILELSLYSTNFVNAYME